MMNRIVAILIGLAIVSVPLQGTPCVCHGCGDAAMQPTADAERDLSAGDSCCGSSSDRRTGPEKPFENQPDKPRPCDDCPRSCCTAGKVVGVQTLLVPSQRGGVIPFLLTMDDRGSPCSAHLDRLQRPPIRVTPA